MDNLMDVTKGNSLMSSGMNAEQHNEDRRVLTHPEYDQHEQVVFCDTPYLQAIIAIHNSTLGVATGGCRIFPMLMSTQH